MGARWSSAVISAIAADLALLDAIFAAAPSLAARISAGHLPLAAISSRLTGSWSASDLYAARRSSWKIASGLVSCLSSRLPEAVPLSPSGAQLLGWVGLPPLTDSLVSSILLRTASTLSSSGRSAIVWPRMTGRMADRHFSIALMDRSSMRWGLGRLMSPAMSTRPSAMLGPQLTPLNIAEMAVSAVERVTV